MDLNAKEKTSLKSKIQVIVNSNVLHRLDKKTKKQNKQKQSKSNKQNEKKKKKSSAFETV